MALVSTPLKPNNAIESVSFVVGFARGLSQATLLNVKAALQSLKDLPGVGSGVAPIQLGGMPNANSFGIEVMETSRFIAKPDGTPSWLVQAIGNVVQVQCLEYTNFQDVWQQARRYLLCALSAVEVDTPVAEVGLQFIDKFLYPAGGDWNEYEMKELFNPDSIHLTRKSLRSGALWHVYQGWFEAQANTRILHQLNLSNTVVLANRQLSAVIDHRGALRAPTEGGLLDFKPLVATKADGTIELDDVFRTMHLQNRATIEDLLNKDKLQLIGINKGN